MPTAFVFPGVVPGTVADREVDARYTAPPPRGLKCPSGEFLGDSVVRCLIWLFVMSVLSLLCDYRSNGGSYGNDLFG